MTVGWIRERDEERFFEARYRVSGPAPPPDNRLQCPFCGEKFDGVRSIYDHLHAQHSVPRPFLLVRGREPASHDFVGEAVGASDVSLFNCSHVQLALDTNDLQDSTPAILQRTLASKRSGIARIHLVSGESPSSPVSQEYFLRFSVASEDELARVDRIFVSKLGRSGPHLSSVDEFLAESGEGPWGSYAGALADYVVGVLSKDKDLHTGVRPPFADYAEHFRRALTVLSKYDRPLPFLLGSIIRFALNDFDVDEATGFHDLDSAIRILRCLSTGAGGKIDAAIAEQEAVSEATKAVCPVDAGTSQVLAVCRRLRTLDRWSALETEMVDSVDAPGSIGALDRSKVIALLAWTALRLDQRSHAAPLLERLTGNDCFSLWAATALEGSTQR